MGFPIGNTGEETFRFKFGGSIVLFTEKGVLLFAKPRSYLNLIIWIAIGVFPTYTLSLFIHASILTFLTAGLFWIPLIYELANREFKWFQGRKLSKLSDSEIIEKEGSKGSLVSWEEIRGLDLQANSLTVTWYRGLRTRKMKLKFDPSSFEKLKLFLTPRLGEKLAAVRDLEAYLQERSTQSLGVIQKELFQVNLRRYVICALLGGAALILAGYLASALYQTGQPDYVYPLVVASSAAGFALSTLSLVYLSSSVKELARIDRARFKFLPLTAYGTLGCIALFAGLSLVKGLASFSSKIFIISYVVAAALLPIAVMLLGVLTVKLVRRIGPLYNKGVIVLAAVLLAGSLVFFTMGPLFLIAASSSPSATAESTNVIVNVTTIIENNIYTTNSSEGWIGSSYNPGPSTGDNVTVYGYGTFTVTITSHPVRNQTHTITSLSVLTPGFSVVSVQPSLPFVVSSTAAFNVSAEIQVPDHNFTGPVQIDLYVA